MSFSSKKKPPSESPGLGLQQSSNDRRRNISLQRDEPSLEQQQEGGEDDAESWSRLKCGGKRNKDEEGRRLQAWPDDDVDDNDHEESRNGHLTKKSPGEWNTKDLEASWIRTKTRKGENKNMGREEDNQELPGDDPEAWIKMKTPKRETKSLGGLEGTRSAYGIDNREHTINPQAMGSIENLSGRQQRQGRSLDSRTGISSMPPGAVRIRGVGADGRGSVLAAHGSIEYSMGATVIAVQDEEEQQSLNKNNDQQLAIEDAYLAADEKRKARRQRTMRPPELLDGVVEGSNRQFNGKKYMVIGFLIICVVAIMASAIAIMVVLLPKDNEDLAETPAGSTFNMSVDTKTIRPSAIPTQTPSIPPSDMTSILPTISSAPTSDALVVILDEIRRQFQSPTLNVELQSTSSPQYKAAKWMAEGDSSDLSLLLSSPAQFQQRYALSVIYYSTNGDQWFNKCNFMDPTLHVCDWNCPWPDEYDVPFPLINYIINDEVTTFEFMGVQCQFTNVIALVLESNNLSGDLPHEFQGLDTLRSLYVAYNNIAGTIPFLALTGLQHLDLGDNLLSGKIPCNELEELTNLEALYLEANMLTGKLPNFNLADLKLIGLGFNLFSGAIPPEMLQSKSLQYLWLRVNSLSGTLPSDVRLPSLKELLFNHNDISGTIPDALGECTSLTFLSTFLNRLTGTILPTSMGQLTSLQILWMDDNQLTGEALNWSIIGGMVDLMNVVITNNPVSGTIPTNIGQLRQLKNLHIEQHVAGTYITGTLPTEIGQLQSLIRLGVGGNGLVGTLPSELGNMQALEFVDFSYNDFSGTIPTEFRNLTKLGSLTVAGNDIVGNLTIFCDNFLALADENLGGNLGYHADCLKDEVICDCCVVCCDGAGRCQPNL